MMSKGTLENVHYSYTLIQLNYATVEVTPISGNNTPVQKLPPIEYSTVVHNFNF